jgi:hypothetical protein
MDKKINRLLNEVIKKIDNIEQSGADTRAGRIVPPPSNSLKPKIIVKPKDKK